jgi:hypothetical protein
MFHQYGADQIYVEVGESMAGHRNGIQLQVNILHYFWQVGSVQ